MNANARRGAITSRFTSIFDLGKMNALQTLITHQALRFGQRNPLREKLLEVQFREGAGLSRRQRRRRRGDEIGREVEQVVAYQIHCQCRRRLHRDSRREKGISAAWMKEFHTIFWQEDYEQEGESNCMRFAASSPLLRRWCCFWRFTRGERRELWQQRLQDDGDDEDGFKGPNCRDPCVMEDGSVPESIGPCVRGFTVWQSTIDLLSSSALVFFLGLLVADCTIK